MKDCLLVGFALGMLCGALIVSQSHGAKQVVEKGKKAMKKQIKKMVD